MGASGLLETGLLFDDIARGSIPAIPNRTEHDPVFISNDCPAPEGVVLSLAAGMGNVYSAALFERRGIAMDIVDSHHEKKLEGPEILVLAA